MDAAKFDALVVRLEKLAARKPRTYVVLAMVVAVLGLLILGLAVGSALLSAALVGGFILLLVVKAHFGVLVVQAGKLLILLLIPAFTMVKASLTLLFARFPEPQGREVTSAEAPALFAALDDLRRKQHGPRVHKVLLVDELNAAIVQHPRFGLFGWVRNYLILGLRLLQVLSADEALSVVAHEYGHLSGHHSRLGGFVYRFRATWGRLQTLSAQWRDWGSRLIARLFSWYAPYFNAYTFVLARQNEYLADRTAAEVAGAGSAAAALMRINIAGLCESKDFWQAVNQHAATEPEPIANRSELWQQTVQSAFHEPQRGAFLNEARQRKTDHLDTHPALTDRLSAIGIAADGAALEPAEVSAGVAWLGPILAEVQADFDRKWQDTVAESWRNRHVYVSKRRQRLEELSALDTLTVEERWERSELLEELQQVDPLPEIEAILVAEPSHLPARFRRGMLMLARGDETGIADLEAVMAADRAAIQPGCAAAFRFYQGRNTDLAEQYAKRWRQHSAWQERIKAEAASLSINATLEPVDLDAHTIARIAGTVHAAAPEIRSAYLARRTLDATFGGHDYVLVFEAKRFASASERSELLELVAAQPFPIQLVVFSLAPQALSQFRNRFRRLGIAPLALS